MLFCFAYLVRCLGGVHFGKSRDYLWCSFVPILSAAAVTLQDVGMAIMAFFLFKQHLYNAFAIFAALSIAVWFQVILLDM